MRYQTSRNIGQVQQFTPVQTTPAVLPGSNAGLPTTDFNFDTVEEEEYTIPPGNLIDFAAAINQLKTTKKTLEDQGGNDEETEEMIRQLQEQIDQLTKQIEDMENTDQDYHNPGFYNPDLVGQEHTGVEIDYSSNFPEEENPKSTGYDSSGIGAGIQLGGGTSSPSPRLRPQHPKGECTTCKKARRKKMIKWGIIAVVGLLAIIGIVAMVSAKKTNPSKQIG